MKAIWRSRVTEAAARYGEHAPMAAACCNVCRTCTTTNLVGLATGGALSAAYGVVRFARRVTRRA